MKKLLFSYLFLSLFAYSTYAAIDTDEYIGKFSKIFNHIKNRYVQEPDKQKLVDAAISGMLTSLDPYSSYLVGDELIDFLEQTNGEFGGVGIEIIYEKGMIKVITPIDDLPAAKSGIKAEDYIIEIDKEPVKDLTYAKAVKNMRGAPGSYVELRIIRQGSTKPLDFKVKREIIKIKPIKYHLDNNIAYIRLSSFTDNTISELKKAVNEVKKQSDSKIQGIILDLRNNPGGILEQAVYVSGYFIHSGIIVSMKGRIDSSNDSFSTNKFAPKAPNVPVVVLINEGSASASEIVAGAMQDHKRAVIMGTRSFGKASVQVFMRLDQKTGIKLTEAKYFTPSGRSIQDEGIKPDIIVNQAEINYDSIKANNIAEKILNNKQINKKKELNAIDYKNNEKKSDTYIKDYQYARAYDLLKGLNITNRVYLQ